MRRIGLYLRSSLVGGALLTMGLLALFIGYDHYGAPGLLPGILLGILGGVILNRRDQWSGHHP
jgi:hypothetical protein